MQAYGRALRRDFESYTKNSKTVKGLILRVIGGMHEGLRREGLTLVTAEEAMEDSSAPTAKWLMTASCRILDATLDDEEDVKEGDRAHGERVKCDFGVLIRARRRRRCGQGEFRAHRSHRRARGVIARDCELEPDNVQGSA